MVDSKLVSDALFNIIHLLQSSFSKSFQENHICHIPKSHFKVMIVLKQKGKQNLKAIAEQLDIAVPNASKVLRDLEEKKFIDRYIPEDNRRITYFSLSEEGMKHLGETKGIITNNIEKIIVNLDDNEITKLYESVIVVHDLFEKAVNTKKA